MTVADVAEPYSDSELKTLRLWYLDHDSHLRQETRRLLATIDALRDKADALGISYEQAVDDAGIWRSEAKTYREALERIDDDGCDTRPYATNCDSKCKDIARAVLGGAK